MPSNSLTPASCSASELRITFALSHALRQYLSVLLTFWAVATGLTCFTDYYKALDESVHVVLLVPIYGPIGLNLPSDADKDRVYEFYYVKVIILAV